MERERKTYPVKDVLEIYFTKHRALGYRVKSLEVLRLWDDVVDDYVKSHSKAVLVKDGILTVYTDSSPLSNELSLREKELVKKINDALNVTVLKGIFFKSGFIKKGKKNKDIREIPIKSLSIKTLKRIDNTVQSIKEEELREILKKLFISSAQRSKNP